MSVEVMAAVFKRYPVGGGEYVLALALADHAHDDGTCIFPSVKQLAKKTRQSERSVQYQLRKMEEFKFLIVSSMGGRGAKDTREWCINPVWILGESLPKFENRNSLNEENKGVKIAPLNEENKGAIQNNKGATDDNKGATAIAPESSVTISKPSDARDALPVVEKIHWDAEQKMFVGISKEKFEEWEKVFPNFDIDRELANIDLWYVVKLESSKRHNHPWKNPERGIDGWLSRSFKDSRKPKVFIKQQPQHHAQVR